MVLQSPFKGSSSSHESFPPLQESVCIVILTQAVQVARIVAEWHGRDVLAILMSSSMHIKSEHNICYVCYESQQVG